MVYGVLKLEIRPLIRIWFTIRPLSRTWFRIRPLSRIWYSGTKVVLQVVNHKMTKLIDITLFSSDQCIDKKSIMHRFAW